MKIVLLGLGSALAVVGFVLYLVLSSSSDAMVYYKTVGEVLAERTRFEVQPVRVNGLLVEGSVRHKPNSDEYLFKVAKQGQTLDVEYRGVLPDTMLPGRELVIQGVLVKNSPRFAASDILTKCPSKYEAEARAKDQ